MFYVCFREAMPTSRKPEAAKGITGDESIQPFPPPPPNSPADSLLRPSPLTPLDPMIRLQLRTLRPPLPLPPRQRGFRRRRPTPPPPPPSERRLAKYFSCAILTACILIPLIVADVRIYKHNYNLFVRLIPSQIMVLITIAYLLRIYIFSENTAVRPNCQEIPQKIELSIV